MKAKGKPSGSSFWLGEAVVGVCLLALLGMMVLAAHLPLGTARGPAIGGLAVAEALIVGLVSMKLLRAPALMVLSALAGVFFVAALFAMTLTDYPFRQTGEQPRSFPEAVPADAPPSPGTGISGR